jgi:hypothetical protein
MPIKPEHLDELLSGYEKPEDLLGEDGLFKQLKKALLERALGAELTHHLGYEKGDPAGRGSDNHRNGSYPKTVLTEDGAVDLDVPRDRNGTFDPQIVPKGETRLDGFDDKIISMYARGMTVREIQGHLRELYAVDVSPDLISRACQARPLLLRSPPVRCHAQSAAKAICGHMQCSKIIRQAEAGYRGVAGRGARSRGPPPCYCCSSPGQERRTGP